MKEINKGNEVEKYERRKKGCKGINNGMKKINKTSGKILFDVNNIYIYVVMRAY